MNLKKLLKVVLASIVICLLVSVGYKYYKLWPHRNTINDYLWFSRPDIAWAFEFIDEAEEGWKAIRAEVAAWYLVRSESEETYAHLRNRLIGECLCIGCFIPEGHLEARILGLKDSVKSIEVLNDLWMGRSNERPSCDSIVLIGLAMKRESVEPFMLMVARNSSGDYFQADRYDALKWLGRMVDVEDEEFSYCIKEGACEPFGPEITKEWVDTLVQLLGDADPEIRWRAASVLLRIGDESGIEAVIAAFEREGDWHAKRMIEVRLERFIESVIWKNEE